MSLKRQDVENIAWLARLSIDDHEIDGLVEELSQILEFVEQLATAPDTGVEPMAHPLDMTQRLREDVVTEIDRRERYQQDAPDTRDGLYLVPRVIE